uniref:Mur ligase C-terminal domain-containing protein n=1 Tax=Fagus sylvatica TaxID=28930 RepID=A0A2N9G5R3_FAGSY
MIGTICGCHIYDDYAHHPTEIRAVLQAARQRFPFKALWVVFQPHTYSRLAALKDEFATALSDADQVVVTAVYAAREIDVWNVSGSDLAASIIGPPSEYIPSLHYSIFSGKDTQQSRFCPEMLLPKRTIWMDGCQSRDVTVDVQSKKKVDDTETAKCVPCNE